MIDHAKALEHFGHVSVHIAGLCLRWKDLDIAATAIIQYSRSCKLDASMVRISTSSRAGVE